MQNVKMVQMMNTPILAILTKSISYTKQGKQIEVPANTRIVVDMEKEGALIGDDFVAIWEDEYQALICN